MSDYQTITFDQSGPTVRITLDRPRSANTMDDVMTRELASAAARCAHGNVKVVVLTGTGRFFCAGGDLAAFAAAPKRAPYIKAIADSLHRAISTFSRMDAVLITVVNGVAAGAGLSIAASGDLVLAAESATFTMAYTRVGLTPDGSASYYLPRLIGIRRTQDLMLTNRTLTAWEAADWGIVTEVAADDQIATRCEELAARFAASATKSNAGVKKLLLSTFGNGLEEQMELEGQMIAALAASADGREGVDAFLERRAPNYV
jgi:2-(1,2-epoxy-1,2-dihydrophenyl)acetyl-CoA isomerase